MMSMLEYSSDELGGAGDTRATWQNSWKKQQEFSLLASLKEHALALVCQLCPIKVCLEFQLLLDVGITTVNNFFKICKGLSSATHYSCWR